MSEIEESVHPDRKRTTRQYRAGRVLRQLLAGFVVVGLVVGGAGFCLQYRLSSRIDRIDGAFAGLEHRPIRPAGDAAKAINILMTGTRHSDTWMVVHITADRHGATVISIPSDSWVAIPGQGENTIDAAIGSGRPSLAVQTVENLTGLRIDHLGVIDWHVFKELTDTVGGVTVTVAKAERDTARHVTWTARPQALSGQEALEYTEQRSGPPGAEVERVHRQQYFLSALMDEALHQEFRRNPIQLFSFLDTVAGGLAVDRGWSVGDMRGFVISLRRLRSADIGYLTVPIRGAGVEGRRNVAYLDGTTSKGLWAAVREDHVTEWLAAHTLGGLPALD